MKLSVENSYGKARRLLRETGLAIEDNNFVYSLAQWEAIDNEVSQLEADSEMLVLMYETNSDKFIDLTMEIDEHPEDYGRACLCKTCQSYGD